MTRKERIIAGLDPVELSRLSRKEMENLLTDAREIYQKKSWIFQRNPDVYSYSYERLRDKYETKRYGKPLKNTTRNQAFNEILSVSDFLKSKSSTIKGAKDIAREQDIRIFGRAKGKANRAKHRLTREERELLWSAYDEYLHQNSNAESKYGSNRITQELGDMLISKRRDKGVIDIATAIKYLDEIFKGTKGSEKKLKERTSDDSIFSHSWDD